MKLKRFLPLLAVICALALTACDPSTGGGTGAGTDTNPGAGTTASSSDNNYDILTCTDTDGGVYTFKQTKAPAVNASIRAAAAGGGNWDYKVEKVIKLSGTYTGNIKEASTKLVLTIKNVSDDAGVLVSIKEEESFDFTIAQNSFVTQVPQITPPVRREVFGFYGPEWLINYTMKTNSGGQPANRAVSSLPSDASREAAAGSGQVTINVMSFTDEVPGLVEYARTQEINLNKTIVATTNGEYQPTLNEMLEKNEVDIFAAEAAFVLNYSKGWYEEYALPYKDLIEDFDEKLEDAQIAPYVKELGSNSDGDIVALGYQSTGCCFIYRRSLAKEIFGTDDPATIAEKIGADTGNFTKFFEAAAECKKHNVSIMSSLGDIWRMVEASATKDWIDEENDKLYIDSSREAFLDIAKQCIDNGWVNNEQDWTEGWYADMKGKNGSYGDWAVCAAPVTNFWGGTWIFATKQLLEEGNEAKKEAVAKIIEYITLNTGNNGILYKWANGSFSRGIKDSVQSAVVMNAVDGTNELCGGQDIHKEYLKADKKAPGNLYTTWDEDINSLWLTQVRAYARGDKTRNQALADFKARTSDILGL